MKQHLLPFTAAFGAALLVACAGNPEPDTRRAVGRVQAIYVERTPGVFVDHRVSQDGSAARRWAAVVLRDALADGRSFTTARLEDGIAAEVGDTVELEIAVDGRAAGRSPSRVSAIVSRAAERAARLNIKGPRWAS